MIGGGGGALRNAAQVTGRCVANASPPRARHGVGRLPEMHVVTCVRAASGYEVPAALGGGRLDSMVSGLGDDVITQLDRRGLVASLGRFHSGD